MLKYCESKNIFSKYMDKKLLCFQVYGSYKTIVNV